MHRAITSIYIDQKKPLHFIKPSITITIIYKHYIHNQLQLYTLTAAAPQSLLSSLMSTFLWTSGHRVQALYTVPIPSFQL